MRGVVYSVSIAALLLAAAAAPPATAQLQFVEVAQEAGVFYVHGFNELDIMPKMISSGVAAGDYDADGDIDLYVVRGEVGPNILFRNLGNGTFEDATAGSGLDFGGVAGDLSMGPTFGDFDGDGDLDLVIGGVVPTQPRVFRNQGDGTFTEVFGTGLESHPDRSTFSTAFGDYDRDGDLDLVQTHWAPPDQFCSPLCVNHVWRNNGDDTFTNVDLEVGIVGFDVIDHSFVSNFTDLNGDLWPDLIMADDFRESKVFLNQQDGTFVETGDPVIVIDNAMGTSIGDYDNDGDLDWFVTAIFNPSNGKIGNDLYRNRGDGTFDRVSVQAGVDDGWWGWGTCMQDFDNDGHLDIFHVNGWHGDMWFTDPSRLFMNNGDGTFTESAAALGLVDDNMGRGPVCADFDRDGDIDIFTANNTDNSALFRNDGGNDNNFLNIRLQSRTTNRFGVGARVRVKTGSVTQLREIRMGNNMVSQDPSEAHFGIGQAAQVTQVQVVWPDGIRNLYGPQAANQFLLLEQFYDSIGVFDPGANSFLFRHTNTPGGADLSVPFGETGWLPMVGDWDGDGIATPGIYHPLTATFRLKNDNTPGGGHNEFAFGPIGANLKPVAGDWDGDGVDTIGVFNDATGDFLLRNSNSAGGTDLTFLGRRAPWLPVAGDWDGDGVATVGNYHPDRNRFLLLDTAGSVRFAFGSGGGWLPVAGDWDGDGTVTTGLYNPQTSEFLLKNSNGPGAADIECTFDSQDLAFRPVTGQWN